MQRILFIFLDGFGLAPAGADNPLSQYDWPGLRSLLGVPPLLGSAVAGQGKLMRAVDAGLGVEGKPQSATGQVSLFTGVNAARLLGYHLSAYPNKRLRRIIARDNILKRVTEAGMRATFANGYTEEYFRLERQGKIKHSATTLCVLAAGLRFRMVEDFERGEAIYWDITNDVLRQRQGYENFPRVTPEEAGRRLAGLANRHHLTLFESFLPDRVGHQQNAAVATMLAATLDEFISSCAQSLAPDVTLIVCSDHGNIESLGSRVHSENPVPLIAIGPEARSFFACDSITDVAPAIYAALGLPEKPHPDAWSVS